MIYTLGDRRARIEQPCFVAANATIVGSVVLNKDCSIWFNATLRGDNDVITIGEGTNVQDGCVLHTDDGIELTLGPDVTVGHQAMLHGCEVGAGSLIGINSTILNRATIGKNCIVGAHALVTEGKVFPDRSLLMGTPAKRVRQVTDEEVAILADYARHYRDNARRFLQELELDSRF